MSLISLGRRVYRFPDFPIASERSLLSLTLRAIIQHLDFEHPGDMANLSTLPAHLKEHFLSYIAAHKDGSITRELLHTLFEDSSYLCHLDLSRSIGSSISLDSLESSHLGRQFLDFSCLTRLCLARPGQHVSWSSLLNFAHGAPLLTHLSLAYWPCPYEGLAGPPILPALTEFIPRLQFLDIEGCSWFVMLRSIDWTCKWTELRSLNLSQGSMPLNVTFEDGDEAELWLRRGIRARQIKEMVDDARRRYGLGLKPLTVEYGWDPKKSLLGYCVESAWLEIQGRRSAAFR